MSGPDDRGEGTADTDHADVGLAETVSPLAGADAIASTAASEDPAGFAERPVSDKLQRAVARAKIAGKLFASDERVKLGRYHLLELVGSGGMGVVWGAWDPELDRRVAIKLVKATMLAARERILLEGQALAKLSHPNVVPVFDVGVVEEQVYLVMEWVRGKNLRIYCKEPRTVRDIVGVYRDAGLGLSAAHHAGLIHRDFKPDNAIRGDDGRVRVLDFGLAREGVRKEKERSTPDDTPTPSSDLTRGAGTPRYMPPEQASGGALTPAVDQYAFCVSLREALVGRDANGKDADVPGWLEQIITRGTLRDPVARYASMDELLRALARDPRTVWRRRAIVTGALGLAGATFAIGTLRGGSDEPERCIGGKDEIAKTWNDARRDALMARLGALSPFAAEAAPRVIAELGTYRDTWESAHKSACLAESRGELPEKMYERTVGCLARSRSALDASIDVLEATSALDLPNALVAANSLPDATRCATAAALSNVALPAPQIASRVAEVADEVEAARVSALASREEASQASTNALDHANAIGYAPLIARAMLGRGMAMSLVDREHAVAMLGQATQSALAVSDDLLAVEAYARQVYAAATVDGKVSPEVLAYADLMEPIAERAGDAGGYQRALLFMNLGISSMATMDRREEARTWFEKSRALVESGAVRGNAELAFLPSNYATVVDDKPRRDELLAKSVSELSRILGENHPLSLDGQIRVAMFTGDPARAEAGLRDACDRYIRFHNHAHTAYEISDCSFELGWLAEERGDAAAARVRFEKARTLGPSESPVALSASFIDLIDGKLEAAAESCERLAASSAKEQGWARMYAADAYLVCGLARNRLGQRGAARACFAGAVEVLEDLASAIPTFERRLARARAELARLQVASDPLQARELARQASKWYREATGYDELLAELERIGG